MNDLYKNIQNLETHINNVEKQANELPKLKYMLELSKLELNTWGRSFIKNLKYC